MADQQNGIRINPIRFDQTPDTRFFLCRHCRNHVLSWENDIGQAPHGNGILCHNPINVRDADTMSRPAVIQMPVVNVSCNECDRNLGVRFFAVKVLAPNPVIVGRRVQLFTNEMLQWNGTQLVYADTDQPVFDEGIP